MSTTTAATNVTTGAPITSTVSTVARAAGKSLLTGLVSIVVLIGLWWFVLWALRVPAFVGKGPVDIWNYFFTVPAAAENRADAMALLGQTMTDSAIGFAAGMGAALVLAAIFLLFRPVEQTLMPIALLLQSVPLIAIAPIIILIFGRDVATVAVMGGLVVLFPALVTIVFGLRSASPQMIDLVTVYGGGNAAVLRKVALPSSLPSLFAAIRISIPGAITGALIAEWLATGQGIGRGIVIAVGEAKISEVWALAVLITIVSIVLYTLASLLERTVLARIGMRPDER